MTTTKEGDRELGGGWVRVCFCQAMDARCVRQSCDLRGVPRLPVPRIQKRGASERCRRRPTEIDVESTFILPQPSGDRSNLRELFASSGSRNAKKPIHVPVWTPRPRRTQPRVSTRV